MKAVLFIVFLFISANAFCTQVDTAKTANQSLPLYTAIPLQMLGGVLAGTVGFSIFNPSAVLRHDNPANNYALIANFYLIIVSTGIIVNRIGNFTESDSISDWAGIGGAAYGFFTAYTSYSSAIYLNKSYFVRYMAYILPPVIGAVTVYNIVRLIRYLSSPENSHKSTDEKGLLGKLNISPYVVPQGVGLSLQASW